MVPAESDCAQGLEKNKFCLLNYIVEVESSRELMAHKIRMAGWLIELYLSEF